MEYKNLTPICQVLPADSTGVINTDASNILRVLTGEEASFDLGSSSFSLMPEVGHYIPAAGNTNNAVEARMNILVYEVRVMSGDHILRMMEIPFQDGQYQIDQRSNLGSSVSQQWWGYVLPSDLTFAEVTMEPPDDTHRYYYMWDGDGDGMADQFLFDGSQEVMLIPLGLSFIYENVNEGKAYLMWSGIMEDGSNNVSLTSHIVQSNEKFFMIASNEFHYPLQQDGATSSVTYFNTDVIQHVIIQNVEV